LAASFAFDTGQLTARDVRDLFTVKVASHVPCVHAGSPFAFTVNDPNRVTARGDGLSLLQCGQQASFTVNAPGALLRDLDVRVTG